MTEICIIGGGAAGLAAAVSAGRAAAKASGGIHICILEKKESEGKKLLATGNGRCNITNSCCEKAQEILRFFYSIGVLTREEDEGRVYPYCGQASAVLDALKRECESLGVETVTNFSVTRIEKSADCSSKEKDFCNRFDIYGTDHDGKTGHIKADKVLIASGGKAGAQFGCTGDGYKWAKELGHSINRVFPILTPIECVDDISKLKGVRARAEARLYKKDVMLAVEKGEVQFIEDGLSGICIFNLSRFLKMDEQGFSSYEVRLDLIPEMAEADITGVLRDNPYALRSLVPEKLGTFLEERRQSAAGETRFTGINCGKHGENAESLRENTDIAGYAEETAKALKNCTFKVKGAKGWRSAQATAGGVSLDELNMETMESRKVKGLFFAGEIIDYDGPCGGYNLQNAWETGIKAGKAMVSNV